MKPELGPTQLIEKKGRNRTFRTPVVGQKNTYLETSDSRPIWQRARRTAFRVMVSEHGTMDDRVPDGDTIPSPTIIARSPRRATLLRWKQIQAAKDAETAKDAKANTDTKAHAV